MIERCRELKLVATGDPARMKSDAAIMLTVHTMHCLHGGHHRVAL